MARRGRLSPTSSRCASSCPARRAARSASRIGMLRAGLPGGVGGLARLHAALGAGDDRCSATASARLGDLSARRLAARAEDRRRRGGGAGGLGHGAQPLPRPAARHAGGRRGDRSRWRCRRRSGQVGAIVAGGLIGWRLARRPAARPAAGVAARRSACRAAVGRRWRLFFALLVGLPLLAAASGQPGDARCSTRSTAPARWCSAAAMSCCRCCRPRWCRRAGSATTRFLAGYGAAQAVPGPLFTFAAYLGTVMGPAPNGWLGGLLCLVAIFLPSFLLLIGVLPFWDALRRRSRGAVGAARGQRRGGRAAAGGALHARSGPARSSAPARFRARHRRRSCCWRCGSCRPGWWWCSAPWPPLSSFEAGHGAAAGFCVAC